MGLISWLCKRASNSTPPARARFRPRVEALEDRLVPTFTHSALLPIASIDAEAILTADLNNDGRDDIIIGHIDTDLGPSVSVLLSKTGKSGFEAAQTKSIMSAPSSLVAGDFNNDGNLDVAASHRYGSLSVLLGNGDGTFRSRHDLYDIAGDVVAVGHFNGDGNLDLVTSAGVLWGHGDGRFGSFVDGDPFGLGGGYRTPGQPRAIGDADKDGRPEFIVLSGYTNSISTVYVLPANGDGTFGAPASYGSASEIHAVTVADFQGDGMLDIAVASNPSAGASISVEILLNDGAGAFSYASTAMLSVWFSDDPIQLAAADFNGDGKQDLITVGNSGTSGTGYRASVLLGNGDGTFRVAPDIVTPLYSKFFALGDFNHDGYADLAVLRTGDLGNYFDLLLNDKQWGTKPRRR